MTRSKHIICAIVALPLVALACGDDGTSAATTTGGGSSTMNGFDAQVARGQTAYGDNCARCHGDAGQGTMLAPPLVGDGALPKDPPPERTVRMRQFVTAFDVFDFARQNMPADAPGTLEDSTYLDIVAFDLFANGLSFDDELSQEDLKDVTINP